MHFPRRQLLLGAGALALAACRPAAPPGPATTRIVVVGAGLSGLVVARELTKRGADVLVIEATSRVGGRIRTVREFQYGHVLEAGAAHVVADPGLMALIDELQLHQVQMPRIPRARVELRGAVRRVYPVGTEPPDEYGLSAEERALGPDGRRARFFGIMERFDPRKATYDAEARALDQRGAAAWLREQGASPGYVASIEGMFPLGDGLGTMSALALVRELAALREDMKLPRGRGRIVGGTDQLPEALARTLPGRIRYGTELRALEHRPHGATLIVRDVHGMHRIEAARVVLTLPFSVLRRVVVTPEWSEQKLRAVRELDSTSVTRAWLETKAQPWLARGEAGSADTDLALGRIRDELEGTPHEPGENGLLGTYLSGAAARAFGALEPEGREAALDASCRQVHPDLQALQAGAVVWDREPFARGGYAYFKPGQLTTLAAPAAAPEGVVHFAGCGTSWRPGFMHGALDSANRVLAELG